MIAAYCRRTLLIVCEGKKSSFNILSAASPSNDTLKQVLNPRQLCRHQHSDLCKAAHEVSQRLWIWTLQLLDDLKTLVELSEDVHHGAGEEGVFRRLLEL